MDWNYATIQLNQIQPWERNPKNIGKKQAERLLDLWQRIGQFQTIAIGPSGEVYDGHQRLSVLKAAYGDDYEVKALQSERELEEKEREELVIAAHSGTTGQWDWDALASWDTGELQEWGLDNNARSERAWTKSARVECRLEPYVALLFSWLVLEEDVE